jgi:hypothetical protein
MNIKTKLVTLGCVSIVSVVLGFKLSLEWEFVVNIGKSKKECIKNLKAKGEITLSRKSRNKYLKGNKIFNEDKWLDKSK